MLRLQCGVLFCADVFQGNGMADYLDGYAVLRHLPLHDDLD